MQITSVLIKLGRPITLCLSILVTVLINRLMGEEYLADYGLIVTYISLVSTLTTIGIGQTMIAEFELTELKEAVTYSVLQCSIVIFLMLIVLFVYYKLFGFRENFLFVIIASIFVSYTSVYKNLKVLQEQIHKYYLVDVALYLIISLLVLTSNVYGFSKVGLLLVISHFVVFLFSLYRLVSLLKLNVDLHLLKSLLRNGAISTSSLVVFYLCNRFNVIASSDYYNFDKVTVSYIVLSMLIVDGITLFITSFVFSDVNKIKSGEVSFSNYIFKYLITTILLVFVLFTIGLKIVSDLYGVTSPEEFYQVSHLLIACIPAICVIKVTSYFFLMNKKYVDYFLISLLYVLLLVICNFTYTETLFDMLQVYICTTYLIAMISVAWYMFRAGLVDYKVYS